MKKIILICITTMLSQYALAENWKLIIKDPDGSFYLDTDRLVKKGKIVDYWAKFVADADNEELEMKKGDYTLSHNLDHCVERTTSISLVEDYLKNGELINRDDQASDPSTVDDDEINLAFFQSVCK
ncbi:surface-adhesin E family protein [Acinetobacter bereziniae]|uniref:surface-adhesin E family protein n=1 Tax=Acinetobacter bereziniae TaxID=106648 RepID=UPI003AF42045